MRTPIVLVVTPPRCGAATSMGAGGLRGKIPRPDVTEVSATHEARRIQPPRRQQTLDVQRRQAQHRYIAIALEADVAAAPVREELAVEAEEPLELEQPIEPEQRPPRRADR